MIRIFSSLVVVLIIFSVFRRAQSSAVMSIDLGNEFMKIAVVKPGIPMEIALNKESRRKTPIIVSINGKDREFGDAALSRANKIPGQSYIFLRELLGKNFDHPDIEQYLKRFPFFQMGTDPKTNQLTFKYDSDKNYSVEELLAMILNKAREYASDFAEQAIESAVITVPPYFSQSERRAIRRAADLADLKVIQLMNDNTAAALNFGIFRRKDFNKTDWNFILFDMGSQSTSCTIGSFKIVRSRENGFVEEVPQLTIKSVSFDRTLGGLEFQIRLRDFFVKKFHEKYPKIDLRKNGKALTKLFREAERAKHVLSANNEYLAQVEGLVDEIDFRQKITREEFERISEDLFRRIGKTVGNALQSSDVKLKQIEQVLLFGGSTRIPRVQKELEKTLKGIELGKSLNTDEAAALGAVYQAAALTKGFRVKKFIVKDSNSFPLDVLFKNSDGNSGEKTIFPRFDFYPNRKSIRFARAEDDFSFGILYGNSSFRLEKENREICRVFVSGVRSAYEKFDKKARSNGVKVHFQLDESSFLVFERAEFLFEKNENRTRTEEKPSTLSKIKNRISNFFSSKTTPDEILIEDENPTTLVEPNFNETQNFGQKTNETKRQNATIIREKLNFRVEITDFSDPTNETIAESRKKLADFDYHERALAALSKAKNNLESFIYDIRDKLEHDSLYRVSITPEERTKIDGKLTEIDAWLWDDGLNADVKALQSKLDELKNFMKPLKLRVDQAQIRETKVEELDEALNVTQNFLYATRELFLLRDDLEKPISESDIKYVNKIIKETYAWRDAALLDFSNMRPTDTPKYLSTDFDEKISQLKKETANLMTKIQRFVPKPKLTTTNKPSSSSTSSNQETTHYDDSTTQDKRPDL